MVYRELVLLSSYTKCIRRRTAIGVTFMAKFNWTNITREDVVSAIDKLKKYNLEYPEPRSTFVLYNGEKLPAKHIRGMAYMEHSRCHPRKLGYSNY